MKTSVLGMILCCCLSSSYAADADNLYAIRGGGQATCEVYVQERAKQSSAYFMITGWLDGYVTGVNRYAPETYDALSFESTDLVAGLLENHCKSRPGDRMFAVVDALLTRLRDDRLRARSPAVKGKVGAQEFTLYAEVLQRVQRKLAALGQYQGDPEPEFGDRTREALAAFQGKHNLKATGLPDQVTLWRLLRPSVGDK